MEELESSHLCYRVTHFPGFFMIKSFLKCRIFSAKLGKYIQTRMDGHLLVHNSDEKKYMCTEKQHQGVESISFSSSFMYKETRHAVPGSETKVSIAHNKGISRNIGIFFVLVAWVLIDPGQCEKCKDALAHTESCITSKEIWV